MKRCLPLIFVLFRLLFWASPALAEERENSVGFCLLHHIRMELVRDRFGDIAARRYHRIFYTDLFFRTPELKRMAFDLLSYDSVPWEVFDEISALPDKDKKELFESLERLPTSVREEILSSPESWDRWKREKLRGGTRPHAPSIDRGFLEKARDSQASLETKGIRTRFHPGQTLTHLKGEGHGVLEIQELRGRTTPGILPLKRVIETDELRDYLAAAEAGGGAIVFDPDLPESGGPAMYFSKTTEAVPGKNWVIAIRENTHWASFLHEWEHKIDKYDLGNQGPERQTPRLPNRRKSALGRAFRGAGMQLEYNLYSELNATARALGLFWETRAFAPAELKEILLYRTSNQRKVALARIFVDPLNPQHYCLYLWSRAKIYVPIAAGAGALGLALSRVIQLDDRKKELDRRHSALEDGAPAQSRQAWLEDAERWNEDIRKLAEAYPPATTRP